ncbi:MAG: isoprenyl transferase [Clostridia bacterium]
MPFWKQKVEKAAGVGTENLDLTRLPRHVAIIMDGNGRWAQGRGLPRSLGHRAGVEALRAIVRESSDLGIEALSLYAFSTENWKRTKEEVGALMALLLEFFSREIDELHANRVCIRILGDVNGLPAPQREAVCNAQTLTCQNDGLRLNIALNYGSRAELARAARNLAQEVADGQITPEQIDEEKLAAHLYTQGLPDVDLVIRTSGELRLSNFLLFQCSYAEFIVVDTLWPDFDVQAYHQVLRTFQTRQRRFGGR